MKRTCSTCKYWGKTVWHGKYRICLADALTEAPVMSEAEYGCNCWQKKEAVKRG